MSYDKWLLFIFLLTCTLYAAHAVGKQGSPRIDRGNGALTVWSERAR